MELKEEQSQMKNIKKRIVELAEDKLTSDKSSIRKIAKRNNKGLKGNNIRDSRRNILTTEKIAINKCLKKACWKLKKARRVFFLKDI